MVYEFDEMNNKARNRDMAYRHRQLRLKRARMLRWFTGICVAAVCLLVVGILIGRSVGSPGTSQESTGTTAPSQTTTAPTAAPTTAPTVPTEPETVIHLTFGGDLKVTDKTVAAGEADGRYDYTHIFMDAVGVLAGADATFLNFEGNACGAPYGTESVSAPQELLDCLAAAGVDMLQLANSYSIYNGLTGLSATLNAVGSAGMTGLGVFPTTQAFRDSQGFTLVNIGGIRVALVAFTKGMDGMSLPAGGEHCVNLLYTDYATTYQKINEDGIRAVLRSAQAQQPDITIAMVHWGSEYNDTISPSQGEIVELMQEEGVDAIVGNHSHFVQQIVYDEAAGTVVAYSLGDFFGDGEHAGTNYSVLLQLEITRDNRTGETKITGCDYTGLYLLTPEKDNEAMRIVRIENAMALYENNHVGKVTDLAYQNMQYAWKRIQARVAG